MTALPYRASRPQKIHRRRPDPIQNVLNCPASNARRVKVQTDLIQNIVASARAKGLTSLTWHWVEGRGFAVDTGSYIPHSLRFYSHHSGMLFEALKPEAIKTYQGLRDAA